jgi:hypothetical protein
MARPCRRWFHNALRRYCQFSRRPNCHGCPPSTPMPSRSRDRATQFQAAGDCAGQAPPVTGPRCGFWRRWASVDTSLQGTASGLGCLLGGSAAFPTFRCGPPWKPLLAPSGLAGASGHAAPAVGTADAAPFGRPLACPQSHCHRSRDIGQQKGRRRWRARHSGGAWSALPLSLEWAAVVLNGVR